MRPAHLLFPAVLAATLAAVALTSGCSATAPAPPPAAPGAQPVPAVPAVALPWPARSSAEAAGLQQAADTGAQPWLLDRDETALSYTAAAYGWTTTAVDAGAAGTVVVTGPGGARRTLTLVQPERTGPGGIWSVAEDVDTGP